MTSTMKIRRMARPITPSMSVNDGTEAAGAQGAADVAGDIRPTKQSLVLTLLRQDGGVSLAALAEATGWLPHTTRAALTGLRKNGHAIVRGRVDGLTRYTLATGPVA
jgi:Protein of unknown function (DUF3489)